MKLNLLTWNSISIQSSSIKSYIPPGQMTNLSANAVTVNRADNFPSLSARVLNAHVFVIGVYIPTSQNINTNRELIKQYFNITDNQRHNLIATDENNSNKQYYLTGFPVRIVSAGDNKPNEFFVTLQVEYPYWQESGDATNDQWSVTADSDTQVITNAGNISVPPLFRIVPLTTWTKGLKYRRYIPLYSNVDKSYISPYELTNGGLDVQILINANKMQADGDDFRVWQNGAFADRWLYEMDSDSDPARCWINLELSQRTEALLLSNVDSNTGEIFFQQTPKSLNFLKKLKYVSNRTIYIDSEAMTFDDGSSIDIINYSMFVNRDMKTTTASTHTAGTIVRHIEHDLWILYGDSDLTSQAVDSDMEPILDLSSTNTLWSYTNFYDRLANRPGAWFPETLATRTGLSYTFTGDLGTFVDPSTKLGLTMKNTDDFQVSNEAGVLDWLYHHPAGITNVKYSGDYRTVSKFSSDSDNSWPANVGLQYLQNNGSWFNVYSDSNFPPEASDSWTAFDSFDLALGGTYETIRFVMDGQLNSIAGATAQWQGDTVVLTLDSDNVPTSSILSEDTINFLDFTIYNTTTGEYLKVKTPCKTNQILDIDCVNRKAYLDDGTRVNVILSSHRNNWLDLVAGNNTLKFVDAGTNTALIAVIHRDRII